MNEAERIEEDRLLDREDINMHLRKKATEERISRCLAVIDWFTDFAEQALDMTPDEVHHLFNPASRLPQHFTLPVPRADKLTPCSWFSRKFNRLGLAPHQGGLLNR